MSLLLLLGLSWGELPLALTPAERMRAAQEGPPASYGWQWLLLIMVGVLTIACIGLISYIRRRRREERADWDAFYREAKARGLNQQEVDLLKQIAAQSGVRHPDAVFAIDTAFYQGTQEFRHSSTYERMAAPERSDVDKTLAELRAKLAADDDEVSSDAEDAETHDSRNIRQGERLSLLLPGQQGSCSASVTQSNAKHLGVKPDTPLTVAPGEDCRVQYFDGRTLWEFNTTIVAYGMGDDELLLGHSDQLRFIDRRRFHRVPVQRPALLAPYNFHIDDAALKAPEFTEALVIEMAGPGLKVRTPLALGKGDHILIVVQYKKDRSFQGIARVVRVDDPRRMIKSVALEMLGLTPKEISKMTTVTNAAAIQKRKDDEREQQQAEAAARAEEAAKAAT